MTPRELTALICIPENCAAYADAMDKTMFTQDLIEGQGVETTPGSDLCDYVEDALVRIGAAHTVEIVDI